MTTLLTTVEMPALPENQKSYAGIPEAIFLVNITHKIRSLWDRKDIAYIEIEIGLFLGGNR